MKAIKATIGNKQFLFPAGFDYPFPEYLIEHRDTIQLFIDSADKQVQGLSENCEFYDEQLNRKLTLLKSELAEFKKRTGVLGFPFDMKDVDLFILSKEVNVTAEFTID